jgi:hypothetical protein
MRFKRWNTFIVTFSRRLFTLRRYRNVHRRRDAMRSQRTDQRQEPSAIVLLVGPQFVVFLTLRLSQCIGHDFKAHREAHPGPAVGARAIARDLKPDP